MSDNDDIEQDMTEEEIKFKNELDSKLSSIENRFTQFGFSDEQIQNLMKEKDRKELDPVKRQQIEEKLSRIKERIMNLPTIDAKGREILTNEEIHNRYNSSWLGFTAMPVCYHNYKAKIQITIPLTFFMAYTYEAHSLLQKNKKIKEMTTRRLAKAWGVALCVGILACTIDSVFFDDYCDIKSYHYNKNQSRKSMLLELRKKLRPDE